MVRTTLKFRNKATALRALRSDDYLSALEDIHRYFRERQKYSDTEHMSVYDAYDFVLGCLAEHDIDIYGESWEENEYNWFERAWRWLTRKGGDP